MSLLLVAASSIGLLAVQKLNITTRVIGGLAFYKLATFLVASKYNHTVVDNLLYQMNITG